MTSKMFRKIGTIAMTAAMTLSILSAPALAVAEWNLADGHVFVEHDDDGIFSYQINDNGDESDKVYDSDVYVYEDLTKLIPEGEEEYCDLKDADDAGFVPVTKEDVHETLEAALNEDNEGDPIVLDEELFNQVKEETELGDIYKGTLADFEEEVALSFELQDEFGFELTPKAKAVNEPRIIYIDIGEGNSLNLTLNNVFLVGYGIPVNDANVEASGVNIKSGDVTIELDGVSGAFGGECGAGVGVSAGASVTIQDANGDGGTLYAYGGAGRYQIDIGSLHSSGTLFGGAGIGGNAMEDAGDITIKSGNVIAVGGNNLGTLSEANIGGAGIGAGGGLTEAIEIDEEGNEVGTAKSPGAGKITIAGGNVTAQGGIGAAGIGLATSLLGAQLDSISVTGGNVNARGGHGGAGLGTGITLLGSKSVIENGINISTDGTVKAVGVGGAAIGAGYTSAANEDYEASEAIVNGINISRGTVEATGLPGTSVLEADEDGNPVVRDGVAIGGSKTEGKVETGDIVIAGQDMSNSNKLEEESLVVEVVFASDDTMPDDLKTVLTTRIPEGGWQDGDQIVTSDGNIWEFQGWTGDDSVDGVFVVTGTWTIVGNVNPPAVDNTVFAFDVSIDATTQIEDPETPLSGLLTIRELVTYLAAREDVAEDEAVEWAIEQGLIDEDTDPKEIVTYGVLSSVMNAYCDYLEVKVKFECDGADDMIAVDAGELVTEFLAKLDA